MLDKSVKFTPLIAVQMGGLARNKFWLVATQKKEWENNQTISEIGREVYF